MLGFERLQRPLLRVQGLGCPVSGLLRVLKERGAMALIKGPETVRIRFSVVLFD